MLSKNVIPEKQIIQNYYVEDVKKNQQILKLGNTTGYQHILNSAWHLPAYWKHQITDLRTSYPSMPQNNYDNIKLKDF